MHNPCDWGEKEAFWEELNGIGRLFGEPWLILGDFNALFSQQKKRGGRPFVSSSRDGFYQLKLAHGLVDLGSSGPVFTWCNGRSGRDQILERLDKGLANGEWATLFPRALIRNLP